MSMDGWQEVRAGAALIEWSKLARWDGERLVAVKKKDFEPGGHQVVHKEFGRLICWIAFAVGCHLLTRTSIPGLKR